MPGVDRPEDGQQAAPGVVAPFQHFLAVLVGQLCAAARAGSRRRNSARRRVVQRQQLALLGREQEHQPHHDRQRGFVQQRRAAGPRPAACAPWSWSARSMDLDQDLHRMAHLQAQLVGDLLLVLGACGQQGFQRLVIRHAEEAPHAQQSCGRRAA